MPAWVEDAQQLTELRHQVAQASAKLGYVTIHRVGAEFLEVWEDGPAFLDIKSRLENCNEERE